MPLTILALQDCQSAVEKLQQSLKDQPYSLIIVDDVRQFFAILNQSPVNLILIGAHLENESLFQVLDILNSQPQWSDIPCLITRARISYAAQCLDRSVKQAALTFGAKDYVVLSDLTTSELAFEIAKYLT